MGNETSISELAGQITATGAGQEKLHEKAAAARDENVGENVYFRGLIEFSNDCENDCLYCGIRKSNSEVDRYSMSKKEILDVVEWCDKVDYASIVLQSGEKKNRDFTGFVADVVESIKKKFPDIGVTLCVGEQKKKTLEEFFDAGAHRYLLRIETSRREHYERLHPPDMSFEDRRKCLSDLKEIGFQVGSGVMIGSPHQTIENLAQDLLFFKEFGVDMIGMGPYVPSENTPLAGLSWDKEKNLGLSLNMIAALRLLMPQINIASTTALQALHPYGREMGLTAGANIIMPITTPTRYRSSYVLYDDKPCVSEDSMQCLDCVVGRIKSTGLTPAFGLWGDSKHYFRRVKNAC